MHTIDPSELSPTAKKYFDKIEFDADELLVTEIRKHPFGLFITYFTGFFIAALILIITHVLASTLAKDFLDIGATTPTFVRPLVLVGGYVLTALIIIVTLISAFVYQSNVVLVTSEKIAQVLYRNLIARKISQLSVSDIQDVTVHQNSLFARLFNYGTLVIETAGEQQNYTFTYTPDPYGAARNMVEAHEVNAAKFGN